MVKIYINDIFKKFLEKEIKNSVVKYSRKNLIEVSKTEDFLKILKRFNESEIIDEDLIKSLISNYFSKRFLNNLNNDKINKNNKIELIEILDKIFFTNLKDNNLDNDSIFKFISTLANEIIKKIILEYYFINLKEDKLIINSNNKLEIIEFMYMNKYNFLEYYLDSYKYLLIVFLVIETEVFTKSIEINDNLNKELLEETRKFYNLIIKEFLKLKKELIFLKISINQDKHILPKKKDVLKYDFYNSLKNLISTIEEIINEIEKIINVLKEHKIKVVEIIKSKKKEKKEKIKEITLFMFDLINKIIKN